MSLRKRFNIILMSVLLIGLLIGSVLIFQQQRDQALGEVLENAKLMMDAAIGVRKYTVNQVRPNLDRHKVEETFLPQSVPAYAATEVINNIKESRPEYGYKEAVLNPTNPRDAAEDWEKEIIKQFKKDSELKELTGIREKAGGAESFWYARPIAITNPKCLACHSTPISAPDAMLKRYGEENGFGWKLDEVIGIQVVKVPVAVPFRKAVITFVTFVGWIIIIFFVCLILLNVIIKFKISSRINNIVESAEAVSKGRTDHNIDVSGSDEISVLAKAIDRMGKSHQKSYEIIKMQDNKIKQLEGR